MTGLLSIRKRLEQVAITAANRTVAIRYGASLFVVAGATLLRLVFQPLLGNSVPWILYYPAILVAAWYGGFRAGALAAVLSIIVADYIWIGRPYAFSVPGVDSVASIAIFALASLFMSYMAELWHRALKSEAEVKANLERLVRERTEELTKSLAELESFSYTVSHDLRAPLRSMQGYANVLLEDFQQPEPAKIFLERIQKSAERMDHLIQDVLTLSRTNRGGISLECVSLQHLVEEIIQQYPSIKASGAEIAVQAPLHDVLANTPLLTQCLSNLLLNAIKFVSEGEVPRIRIWTDFHDDRVRLNIQDNGIGMDSGMISKIFVPFQRVHPERNFEGNGIGLAIVKKAVDRMKGRVGVESQPNGGSRFWIELAAC